jgi:dsRNA-specific ribonuclease
MIPPLPLITDMEIMLEIYTHPSVRNPSATLNPRWGDASRLELLGSNVYDLALSYHFFSQRPVLSREQMETERLSRKEPRVINDWVTEYGIKAKVCISPNDVHLLDDDQETLRLFYTYIGGLYTCGGLKPVQTWISRLVDPNSQVTLPPETPQVKPPTSYTVPLSGFSQLHIQNGSMAPPPPPLTGAPPPPPPGSPPPMPNPLNAPPPPAYPQNPPSLAIINQTAAQKGFVLSYPAVQEGQAHAPIWNVRCMVNSQEMGKGSGRSQKVAKEEAAQKAWVAMGWGPAPA